MGLKKAYDELTDTPEFSDGFVLPTGQGIVDSDGDGILNLDNTGRRYIQAPEGKKVYLQDIQGGFIAAEYVASDSAPGTLELTNANLDMAGQDITNANLVSTSEAVVGSYSEFDEETTTVSSGVNTIYSPSGSYRPTYFAFVSNRSNSADNFSDIVHVGDNFTNRVSDFSRSNSPTRSYSTSGQYDTDLDIDVSSGGFDVIVTVIGFDLI